MNYSSIIFQYTQPPILNKKNGCHPDNRSSLILNLKYHEKLFLT